MPVFLHDKISKVEVGLLTASQPVDQILDRRSHVVDLGLGLLLGSILDAFLSLSPSLTARKTSKGIPFLKNPTLDHPSARPVTSQKNNQTCISKDVGHANAGGRHNNNVFVVAKVVCHP